MLGDVSCPGARMGRLLRLLGNPGSTPIVSVTHLVVSWSQESFPTPPFVAPNYPAARMPQHSQILSCTRIGVCAWSKHFATCCVTKTRFGRFWACMRRSLTISYGTQRNPQHLNATPAFKPHSWRRGVLRTRSFLDVEIRHTQDQMEHRQRVLYSGGMH
jgi:hypothetical protein